MRSSLAFVIALGTPWLGSAATCNDNCGRAVAGAARQNPPLASRKSQCQAFVLTTVTVTPGIVTVTATPVAERNVHGPRQAGPAPQITGSVPGYASACADITSYWLACQCFSGLTATTVTLTAATPISTITGSPESSSTPASSSPVVTSPGSSSNEASSSTTSSLVETSEILSTAPPPTEAVTTPSLSSQMPSSSPESSGGPSPTATDSPTRTVTVPGSTCKPTAVLPNPTPLFYSGDDQFTFVVLPFEIGVFGALDTNVFVSINGRLSLYGSNTAHTNERLPDANVPNVSMLVFYDDLLIASPDHIVSYQVLGSVSGSRNVTFEWITEHWQFRNQSYHFTATFEEAQPGIVTYRYYTISDRGRSATVGAQNLLRGRQPKFTQYTFDTPDSILDGAFVRLDTNRSGSFTTGDLLTSQC